MDVHFTLHQIKSVSHTFRSGSSNVAGVITAELVTKNHHHII